MYSKKHFIWENKLYEKYKFLAFKTFIFYDAALFKNEFQDILSY
jgi:hypothetical protein